MAIALYHSGIPFDLAGHEVMYRKFCATDYMGIVPEDSLNRCDTPFEEDEWVYDTIALNHLERSQRREVIARTEWKRPIVPILIK